MKFNVLIAVVCGVALMASCEHKDDTKPAPPAPPTTPQPAPTAAVDTSATPSPTAAATPATPTTPATPATPPAAPSTTAPAEATGAAPAGNSAVADTEAQAQSLFTQVVQYIKQNKLDDAQTAYDKLAALKTKLPTSWQTKIDQLKTTLSGAKAANNLKANLPTFGGSNNK